MKVLKIINGISKQIFWRESLTKSRKKEMSCYVKEKDRKTENMREMMWPVQ